MQSCQKARDQWGSRTAHQSVHFPAAWGCMEVGCPCSEATNFFLFQAPGNDPKSWKKKPFKLDRLRFFVSYCCEPGLSGEITDNIARGLRVAFRLFEWLHVRNTADLFNKRPQIWNCSTYGEKLWKEAGSELVKDPGGPAIDGIAHTLHPLHPLPPPPTLHAISTTSPQPPRGQTHRNMSTLSHKSTPRPNPSTLSRPRIDGCRQVLSSTRTLAASESVEGKLGVNGRAVSREGR